MISAKVQYAIAFIHLAHSRNGEPLTVAEFCAAYRCKKAFCEQVTCKLREAGFLEAVKGPGGGYVVKMTQVNLNHLIELFEGKRSVRYSSDHLHFKAKMKAVEDEVKKAYRQVRILGKKGVFNDIGDNESN